MRRHFIASLLLACAMPAALSAQAPLRRGRSIAPDAAVRIFNLAGTIRVTAWERDSIDVTAVVPEGAGEFLFGGGSAGVKLGISPPPAAETFPGSLLEVKVPARARVWVKTESAEVLVSGLTGPLDLSSVSGRIVVTGSPSELAAESMDGGIDVRVTSPLVRLKTAGGTIVLRGQVEDATISTVSGAATAVVTGLARSRMEAVSGHLTFDAELLPGGNYSLESHSGDIDIRLPTTFNGAVDLTAMEGRVVNTLTRSPVHSSNRGRGETASFGGGAAASDLVARTFKGTISIGAQTKP
jgi:hypothetical protein